MALLREGVFVREDTGQHPGDAVREDEGRQFPAGEDIVPDGDLLIDDLLDDPLVDPFVVAAQEDEVIHLGEFPDPFLGQGLPLGRHIDEVALPCAVLGDRFVTVINGARLHDHAGPAAVRVVVYPVVFVTGVVPDVDTADVHVSRRPGPADDALGEERFAHLREQSHDVDPHRTSSASSKMPGIGRTRATSFSMSTDTTIPGMSGIRYSLSPFRISQTLFAPRLNTSVSLP